MSYDRVAAAIRYLRAEAPRQPPLAEVAAHVHLSPEHFQRVFTNWAGVSPKHFARTLTVDHAKRLLATGPASPSLFDVADEVGLSSPSRLHDSGAGPLHPIPSCVRLEAMTPGEYRSGGAGLDVGYAFAKTRFGDAMIASTKRGICTLAFGEDLPAALRVLRKRYPAARLHERSVSDEQRYAMDLVDGMAAEPGRPLALHVGGTAFQHQVWRALLEIAPGTATTYGRIGAQLGKPGAGQAIGGAVGANRVAWLIPCHRVLRGDGGLGGYAWGEERKAAMLGVEA